MKSRAPGASADAGSPAPHAGPDVRAALRVWRDSLVDLNDTSRLLHLQPAKGGIVRIVEPGPDDLVARLGDGGECAVTVDVPPDDMGPSPCAAPPDEARTPGADTVPTAVLQRLRKRSRQEYLDRGVPVLHLALGTLRWRDEKGCPFASPVLLMPVELTAVGPGESPRIRWTGGDTIANPALALRLRERGIDLPAPTSPSATDLPTLWADLRSAVAGHADWAVQPTAVLACLTFHKEAIYRDLADNEARIVDHPAVRALAAAGTGPRDERFDFDPLGPARTDDLAAPEDMPLVLDADVSQRACVAAVLAGRSFVLDGPPGTGKSQTIANMIGALLHAGRRVLFVSEKAAALDVVHHRLADAGLAFALLDLGSHQVSRKEVAAVLAAAGERPVASRGDGPPVDHGSLRDRRTQLTAYAEAVNEVREPLGWTLHDVIGLCAGPAGAPDAPVPALEPDTLTPEAVRRVRDAADRLAQTWRVAVERHAFAWRDVLDRRPLDTWLYRAQEALEGLAGAMRRNRGLVDAFGLVRPGDAGRLAALADAAGLRPAPVRDEWLTGADLGPARQALDELERGLAAVRRAAGAVSTAAGVSWPDLPDPADLPPVRLPELTPSGVDPGPLTAAVANDLADRFAADADRWEGHRHNVDQLTTRLGLPPVGTFSDLCRVVAIAELGTRRHRPERFWFGAGGVEAVSAGAAVLRRCLEVVVAVEVRARPYFSEAIVTQPVDQLAERFATVHRGPRKLLAAYRRDLRAVAAFVLPTVDPAEAVSRLTTAVAWKHALADLAAAERQYAPMLGRYWRGRGTDFRALDEAIQVAAEVRRLTPPEMLPAVVAYVCGAPADPGLIGPAARARDDVLRWPADGRRELATGGIDAAVRWLRSQVEPLRAVAAVTRAVNAATGRDLDFAHASRLVALRRAAAAADAALRADGERYAPLTGGQQMIDEIDPVATAAAIDWAATVRRLASGTDRPLTADQLSALATGRPDTALPGHLSAWTEARTALLDAFAPARRVELAAALDDVDAARELLRDLRGDPAGQEEWLEHVSARETLSAFGLDAAIAFGADRLVDAAEVRPLVERALLRAWVDAVLRADPRLHPPGSARRDRLVDDFRRLDEACVAAWRGEVAARVDARRAGGVADEDLRLLRREAVKATGHLPVRDLISRARETVLALKPCLLMSPLAVSQFLPPDIRFDVVIFDEASQVTPADAIAGVYRADALVVAGDDRQLPPTSFFDRAVQADDDRETEAEITDFPSILELAKGCGAFRSVSLTWHYRSAHEALIAFSNRAFYHDRLTTFPSAHGDGPDLGIEVIPVPGVYRRGGGRDNPLEADRVADRVLHHLTTRPGRTLGVVTFSVAQAEAIERALGQRMQAMPEHVGIDGDRLHGLFVKSLEAVQGDERDVMIFSIGYGYDEAGRIGTNFGPLNRPNGWRRLNVAITRARRRVEIVTSVRARDIPETDNEGVRLLTAYLEFAERGAAALPADRAGEPGAGPFESSVLATVRSWGYTVRTGIGHSGARVDLGVRHPAYPGEVYALGIRCDGAGYRAFRSARDRDRLHEDVLHALGWKLHRIWSTAWYRDRAGEERRLRAAIEQAVAEAVGGRPPRPLPVPPPALSPAPDGERAASDVRAS